MCGIGGIVSARGPVDRDAGPTGEREGAAAQVQVGSDTGSIVPAGEKWRLGFRRDAPLRRVPAG